jgi:hypothetical protein
VSDHDEESYTIRHRPLVFVTDIGSVFFGFFDYLERECSTPLSRLHILDESDSELIPLATMDGRLDIVLAREGQFHPFPLWIPSVDYVLSFDLFGHMLGVRV